MTKFKLIPAGLLVSAVALSGAVNAVEVNFGGGVKAKFETAVSVMTKVDFDTWVKVAETDFPNTASLPAAYAKVGDNVSPQETALTKMLDNHSYFSLMASDLVFKATFTKDLAEVMDDGASASLSFKIKLDSEGKVAVKAQPTLSVTLPYSIGTFSVSREIGHAFGELTAEVFDGPHANAAESLSNVPWGIAKTLDGGLGVSWTGKFFDKNLSVAATVVPFVKPVSTIDTETKGEFSIAVAFSREFAPVKITATVGAEIAMPYAKGENVDAENAYWTDTQKSISGEFIVKYTHDTIGGFRIGLGYTGSYLAKTTKTTATPPVKTVAWDDRHDVKLSVLWTSVDEKWSAGVSAIGMFKTNVNDLDASVWKKEVARAYVPKVDAIDAVLATDTTPAIDAVPEVPAKPELSKYTFVSVKNPWAFQLDISGSYKFTDAVKFFVGGRLHMDKGVDGGMTITEKDDKLELKKLGPIFLGGLVYAGVDFSF